MCNFLFLSRMNWSRQTLKTVSLQHRFVFLPPKKIQRRKKASFADCVIGSPVSVAPSYGQHDFRYPSLAWNLLRVTFGEPNKTRPLLRLLYKPIKFLIYVMCLLIQLYANLSTDFAAEDLKLHSRKYFYSFNSFELEVCGRENFVSRAKQSHVVFVQKSKLNNT